MQPSAIKNDVLAGKTVAGAMGALHAFMLL
jgi:hypothetical protein